tara:strand:- start:212517 stop:213344 length:828 start_codon:yes stop_codon:yes gene_type:complete
MGLLMKIFVVVVFFAALFFAWFSSKDDHADGGPNCSSNAYIVSHFRYSEGREMSNQANIEEIPSHLPQKFRTFFEQARKLPINATDAQIKSVFPSRPEVSYTFGIKSFKLSNKDALYNINKYEGCISHIELFLQDKVITSLTQSNHLPSSATASKNQPENSCKYFERTGQRFTYFNDGIYSGDARYIGVVPEAVSTLFNEFKKFNYRRDNLFSIIGSPLSSGTQLKWKVDDVDLGNIEAIVETEENCEKSLTLSWTDSKGEHRLLKETSYNIPSS